MAQSRQPLRCSLEEGPRALPVLTSVIEQIPSMSEMLEQFTSKRGLADSSYPGNENRA